MPSKLLFKNETEEIEVRQYSPQKRCVKIAGRDYFLQFPYIQFASCRSYVGGYQEYNESDPKTYFNDFFCTFSAKEITSINDDVIRPILPNVNRHESGGLCTPKNDPYQIYYKNYTTPIEQIAEALFGTSPDIIIEKISFNELVEGFWNSNFRDYGYTGNQNDLSQSFGRIHSWQEMDLDEVNKCIQKPAIQKWKFRDWIQRITMTSLWGDYYISRDDVRLSRSK
jgi:hypothetical protein